MTQPDILQGKVPDFLRKKLAGQYGDELTARILKGYGEAKPVTLRVNTLKTDKETVKACFRQKGIEFREVAWSETALVVEEGIREPEIRELGLYKEGGIYMQSLSSMLPPLVLAPKEGESVLDMAAAPGGKTTQMAALSHNMASITACERNKIRAERLQYNIGRQGAARVCVMTMDARQLDDFFSFDKVLLDAPCTGSGTLDMCREEAGRRLNEEGLRRSAKLQEELLVKGLKLLKPGHEMVYSTCSILAEENEAVVERALQKGKGELVPIDKADFPGIPFLPTRWEGAVCVCPDRLYEGFFVARLRRRK